MSVETMETIRRDCELLLRELQAALMEAYMAFRPPTAEARRLGPKFSALYRRMDKDVRAAGPSASDFYTTLRTQTERERQRMVRRAEVAYAALPKATGLAGTYNSAVGKGLSQVIAAGDDALKRQIHSLVEKMVRQAVTDPQIPSHVKQQMARSLSGWIQEQTATQDALYYVQNVLIGVSGWLHEKLIVQQQIEDTRDRVKACSQLTCQEADEADRAVGTLAERSRALDTQITQQLRGAGSTLTPYFRINPRLVLDPAKAFLDSLELRAGIRMQPNGVKVDLGAGVKVVDPLSPSRLVINPTLSVRPTPNLSIGVQGESGYDVDSKQWTHSVKASLSWSF